MNHSLTLLLLLGLLLMTIVSPFAALSGLMVILFIATGIWMVKTLLQILVKGPESNQE